MADTDMPVEARLRALFDHLGLARAHVAARSSTDWQGFAAQDAARIASLALVCPASFDAAAARAFGPRLLVISGDEGPGARRVQALLPGLPAARTAVLAGYAGPTWADLAAERGDAIMTALEEFLAGESLPPAGLAEEDGEVAGIGYGVRGAGPPLVLFPLELSPSQWDPLIPRLAERYCTIALGGAELGSVASLEERGRSAYIALVRRLLDTLAIAPGETVLEAGCGSGVIMRELARRTGGANRLIGVDINPYLLREARALARRAGADGLLDLRQGSGEALPFDDGAVDVALSSTVAEELDADRLFAELSRVTRPGGRVGVVVRAVDMPHWVNLRLPPALKAKVDMPGMIGGGVGPRGCADASLYERLRRLGLCRLEYFPQFIAVMPWQPRLARYRQQILAALTPEEAEAWHAAEAEGEAAGTFFIAQPASLRGRHEACLVGQRKPLFDPGSGEVERGGEWRWAAREAFEPQEVDAIDANRVKDRLQVRGQEIGLARRRVAAIPAMGGDDDDRPVAQHADLALRGRAEGAADANDVVDPRLEGRRHREIVHRRADHHEIRRLELGDQAFRQRESRVDVGGAAEDRVDERRLRVGRRLHGEVAVDDARIGMQPQQPVDDVAGDPAAHRIAARADLDLEDRGHGAPATRQRMGRSDGTRTSFLVAPGA